MSAMGQTVSSSNSLVPVLLLNKSYGPNLWRAADDGDARKVARLLRRPGIHVNWQDGEWENTPLFRACLQGHTKVAEVLLGDPRTDENLPNRLGETPFFVACECGHYDLVKLLLDSAGVDINLADMDGATPLWIAANEGHLDVIKLLLASDRHVDVKARTLHGPTTWSNKTAEERARQVLHPEIAHLLREYQVNPKKTVDRLRGELGIASRCAAETFALVVYLSDHYVRLRSPKNPDEQKASRFFRIAAALPMELQMVLCNRMHLMVVKDFVPVSETEEALKTMAQVLEQPHKQKGFRKRRILSPCATTASL